MPSYGPFWKLDCQVRQALQSYWNAPAAQDQQSLGWKILSFSLTPIAWLYGRVQRLRRLLYRWGVFRRRHLAQPVISVGALRVGGSGKTPFVLWLAASLRRRGCRVAILTRGYGSRGAQKTRILLGSNLGQFRPADCGDEPYLMAQALQEVPVAVNPRRYEAALCVSRSFPVDVFLLDDGFQHLKLSRNCDVVLMSLEDAGPLACLPRGPLREPASALADATVIVRLETGTGAGAAGPPQAGPGEKASPARRPECSAVLKAGGLFTLDELQAVNPATVRGKRLAAFCAIARPDSFWKTLEGEGLLIERRLSFPDHHPYTDEDHQRLLELLASVDFGITTEKDAVKLSRFVWPSGRVLFLRVELVMADEAEFWRSLASTNVLGRPFDESRG